MSSWCFSFNLTPRISFPAFEHDCSHQNRTTEGDRTHLPSPRQAATQIQFKYNLLLINDIDDSNNNNGLLLRNSNHITKENNRTQIVEVDNCLLTY